MITRQFTRDELQQAFALAFVLHPSPAVALAVLIKAIKLTVSLERTEARRERSLEHYKSPFPPEALLQFAVFGASLRWELDQESPLPKKEPRYKPTRDDLVVRYLKHLVCNNLVKAHFSSLGIALGCVLHDYKPKQIADLLGLSDELSIHRIKRSNKKQLMKRFKYADVLTADGDAIRTTLANDYDRKLLQEALKVFAPWNTTHIPLVPGESILEKFIEESNLTDWDSKHALLDPECGGLDRLIVQHNSLYARHGEDLEDPALRLFVPEFEDSPTPPVDRFKAPKLTDNEILLLNKLSGARVYDVEGLLSDVYEYGVDESLIELFDDRASSTSESPPLRFLSPGNYAPCGPLDSRGLIEEEGDAMEKVRILIIGSNPIDESYLRAEMEALRKIVRNHMVLSVFYNPDPYLVETIDLYLNYKDIMENNIDLLATHRCLRVLGGQYRGFACSVPGEDLWLPNYRATVWDRYGLLTNVLGVDERDPGLMRINGYESFGVCPGPELVISGSDPQSQKSVFRSANWRRTHGPLALTAFHSMEQEQLRDLKPYVRDPRLPASDWFDQASARQLQDWYSAQVKKTDAWERQSEPWDESPFPLWAMNFSASRATPESNSDAG